ncbi:hypothetical protein OJ996_23435 [Luteolibacter sp. GHJ8]|uniref:Pyrroloquinoline-quinone binding quinoprotein n=1 Tax=Luteolibacter rhizosphaerae TaxID=2989719 RepID=A0ABT3G9T0_9BACT|nr:hypothetical protein [Luteolibacter rhizosphaerae]MCW1916560.1 hypothetical protein [Luteolibacter rhizosphaerae]
MKALWISLLALVLVMPAFGTSIIFPTFSTPVMAGDTLVVVSPDRMAFIGLSKSGKKMWTQPLSTKGSLIEHGSGRTLLVQGSSVSSLNPKDGTIKPLFDSDPKVEWMKYSPEADLFWGRLLGDEPGLALFDGDTHTCLAKEVSGETVAYADAGLVVIAKGLRKPVRGGHTFSKGWIEGFDRKAMKRIWSAPFEKEPSPYHFVVRCGGYVVCEDGRELMVIDVKSGELRRRPAAMPEDALGPKGLRDENGDLVYLTTVMNMSNFHESEQTLYRLRLPHLEVLEKKVMKVIEAVTSEKAGDLLITDALYRTACFRPDGSKLWEHFQMHRTPVIDGVIYFSDYKEGVARMGALDVSTGDQTIFISEKVEMR